MEKIIMNIAPHKEVRLDANSLAMRLIGLRDDGKLWMNGFKPEHEYSKQPLRNESKQIVRTLVKICLRHGVVPFCCVNGHDLTCNADCIITLSSIEYYDLLDKVMPFTAPTLMTK